VPRAGSTAGRIRRSARAGSRTPGGGQANLAVLTADGTPHHYAGNGENPVFGFRLGRFGLVSTGIYSLDRSLFRFVAPGAVERRLVPLKTTVRLDGDGGRVAGA
jgi:hypothetical protein